MPAITLRLPIALCLITAVAACEMTGTVEFSEGAFAAEGENLWKDLVPGPDGEGLLTPVFSAKRIQFDRIDVRFDATDDLEIDARVREDSEADWSDWLPIEVTAREKLGFDGHADLPRGGAQLQLRLRGEKADAASFLAVQAYDRDGQPVQMDASAAVAPASVPSLIMPVGSGGVVLSDNERHFGACRSNSGGANSDCTRSHLGVDIHGRIGKPIFAAADGEVVALSTNSGAGLFLNIDHGGGIMTRYLHLDRTRGVNVGSSVRQGQRIADLGDTGRAGSGPHLHFEVRRSGQAVDPAPHIGWNSLPRVSTAPTGSVDVPPGSDGGGSVGDGGGSSGGLLNPGDRGTDVYRLQHLLEAWRPGILGGSLGGINTARYGPRTLEAVHTAARELRGHTNPSDDYTVGPLFWGALSNAVFARFSGSRRIRFEDTGTDVYRLQHALEAWRPGSMGGSLGRINTAKYGPRTRSAVHEGARELRGHSNPSDTYVVGPLFWRALLDAI